ncbi:hypothetical protein DYU11_18265 [Fibrisoma montanum]|uniref:Uncharacterized protein n=1 Tax=Fibrisoma montanum TaxID=2305895 RepID=A0A418M694_9BACT|nr:hypothetical protein [Fibrisoma montanum]RIV21351.1 hypothetical protein DYU11_18265 [Fibrisoma montanum]
MQVELSDFQVHLCVKALNTFVAQLPVPPETRNGVVNPLDETVHMVRYEITDLVKLLQKPVDTTPKNTFRVDKDKVILSDPLSKRDIN